MDAILPIVSVVSIVLNFLIVTTKGLWKAFDAEEMNHLREQLKERDKTVERLLVYLEKQASLNKED